MNCHHSHNRMAYQCDKGLNDMVKTVNVRDLPNLLLHFHFTYEMILADGQYADNRHLVK